MLARIRRPPEHVAYRQMKLLKDFIGLWRGFAISFGWSPNRLSALSLSFGSDESLLTDISDGWRKERKFRVPVDLYKRLYDVFIRAYIYTYILLYILYTHTCNTHTSQTIFITIVAEDHTPPSRKKAQCIDVYRLFVVNRMLWREEVFLCAEKWCVCYLKIALASIRRDEKHLKYVKRNNIRPMKLIFGLWSSVMRSAVAKRAMHRRKLWQKCRT